MLFTFFLVRPLGGFRSKDGVLADGREGSISTPSKMVPAGALAAVFLSRICFTACLRTSWGLAIRGAVIFVEAGKVWWVGCAGSYEASMH